MAAPGQVRTVISEGEYSSAGFGTARSRQPARPNAHIPDATYRLQFRPEFGFAAARQIVPFLKQLGITHVYASPLFQARAGSPHGYDVTDHNCLNPELGSEEEFDGFVEELRANGMGLVVDIVPNHMSACGENAWWVDVLEDGPESEYANYFDVDWAAGMPGCENKVVLALLGDTYARTLEKQELKLGIDECGLHVRYWEHRFPLSLASYRTVLSHAVACRCGGPRRKCPAHMAFERLAAATAQLNGHGAAQKNAIKAELWTLYQEHAEVRDLLHRVLDSFNGTKGDLRSLQGLDGLLGEQHFVLTYWRTGREHTNYRRFFDINDLVGVRVEEPEVFEATHALLFRLVREGKLAGVRIDHIDGLHDPEGYLQMLEERLRAEAPGGEFFVVAEKILLGYETLPVDWPVCGTTGYDFLNAANAVFVDQRNLGRLNSTYEKFTGLERAFHEVVYAKKKLVMRELFGNDLRRLGAKLCELALRVKETTAAAAKGMEAAIEEITACLPVYRTYTSGFEVSDIDRGALAAAIGRAAPKTPGFAAASFDFACRVLLLDFPAYLPGEVRREWLRFVMRWQQFTGPVMAKGMEDTAFYEYNALVSLNVVGGALRPVSVDGFHEFNAARSRAWPFTLNATSTHDTKRSEDVRARINVLSELPGVWEKALARWSAWNRDLKQMVDGEAAPSANDEILLYQVLIGAWPLEDGEVPEFRDRIRQFVVKAAREAKSRTSWIQPNAAYERALTDFADAVLEPSRENCFLPDFLALQRQIAPFGAMNSLAEELLKITSPGVPDFYQGTTAWDFSLVDPDNRRAVDFIKPVEELENLQRLEAQQPGRLLESLIASWRDGRIKLYTVWKALAFRQAHRQLFQSGEYIPLQVQGPAQKHVIAFARRSGREWALVMAPRLVATLAGDAFPFREPGVWAGSEIVIPDDAPQEWREVFTGRAASGRRLSLAKVFGRFPLGLLTSEEWQ